MAIVVDASALASSLLGASPAHHALRRRLAVDICHAPHLIDAEIGNVSGDASFGVSCPVADAPALLRAAGPLMD